MMSDQIKASNKVYLKVHCVKQFTTFIELALLLLNMFKMLIPLTLLKRKTKSRKSKKQPYFKLLQGLIEMTLSAFHSYLI